MIRGTTVLLHETRQIGVDEFDRPIYKDYPTPVENVLVARPETSQILSSQDLDGKRIEYVLGIPKGDMHNWDDKKVSIFGKEYKAYGSTIQGIEENIPGRWHKIVQVVRYE